MSAFVRVCQPLSVSDRVCPRLSASVFMFVRVCPRLSSNEVTKEDDADVVNEDEADDGTYVSVVKCLN